MQTVVIDIPASVATMFPAPLPSWAEVVAYFNPTDGWHTFHLLLLALIVWGAGSVIREWWRAEKT